MIEIPLTEDDRELCSIAAHLLMALDPGQEREDAGERLLRRYRVDLAAAHPDADPAVIDDMALRFGGALLLEMERVGLAYATDAESSTPKLGPAIPTSRAARGPFAGLRAFSLNRRAELRKRRARRPGNGLLVGLDRRLAGPGEMSP